MKKALLILVALAAGGGVYAFYALNRSAPPPVVATAPVTRGDIADTVGATGTLQAVTTVQVGTQVSGTIQELYADFNSLVRKGQVIARLDPSLFETQIEQSEANLIRAQADLERLKVTLEDTRTKLQRARELSDRQLLPRSELDAAEVAFKATEAQIRSSQASVTQAEASLNQSKVNRQHTVITAPIDGLVISRNVDVGQTVAASMNAPVLFVLAADLTKMQVVANLDESDVGRIRPGQPVSFRVDAYPAEDFSGSVAQVRLQPIIQQNVVTYATVIDVENPQLKLKPGMTANVTIEIARRTDVIRVPNAALRFRPTNEIFAALGQPPPGTGPADLASEGWGSEDGADRGAARGPRTEASGVPAAGGETAPTAASPSAAPGSQAGGNGRGGRGGRGLERLQALSPEERARVLERMRARGFDPTAAGAPGSGRGAAGTAVSAPAPIEARDPGATTFDALFGPLPPVETIGRVWVHADGQLRPLRLRLGISDGQASELLEGDLQPGTQLVTSVTTGGEARPAAAQGGLPPFMGQPGRGGFRLR
jgi:HlyD family secretion protein